MMMGSAFTSLGGGALQARTIPVMDSSRGSYQSVLAWRAANIADRAITTAGAATQAFHY